MDKHKWKHIPFSRMWGFLGLTVVLFLGLAFFSAYMRREEIMANWGNYKSDPLFMFAAPLFKPSDDPRSRIKFATDNFFDVISTMIKNTFMVFLEPVFKIFKIFTDSLTQTSGGLFNLKALLANMRDKWNKMVDPFMRRFYTMFHRFRVTFVKLFSSMQKSFAIAVSSVYAGIATIQSMLSFFDLIMTIIIVILCILIVMVILLFFVLAPFMPMILGVIAMISATAMGGAVGGMAATFCFAKGTYVQTKQGANPIETIKIGDKLSTNADVLAIMEFVTDAKDLYDLYGVTVSGSHIVYHNNIPCHVSAHPDAILLEEKASIQLYCLITSDHKIPIVTAQGITTFADWEEISDIKELQKWNYDVFCKLNPNYISSYDVKSVSKNILMSEALFSEHTQVLCKQGHISIKDLVPGDCILHSDGTHAYITGIVRMNASEVSKTISLGNDEYMSNAVWYYDTKNGIWSQSDDESHTQNTGIWYSLFTTSGIFQIKTEKGLLTVRDFTDIGPDHIHESYEWILKSLKE